jgi:hypothetical protein
LIAVLAASCITAAGASGDADYAYPLHATFTGSGTYHVDTFIDGTKNDACTSTTHTTLHLKWKLNGSAAESYSEHLKGAGESALVEGPGTLKLTGDATGGDTNDCSITVKLACTADLKAAGDAPLHYDTGDTTDVLDWSAPFKLALGVNCDNAAAQSAPGFAAISLAIFDHYALSSLLAGRAEFPNSQLGAGKVQTADVGPRETLPSDCASYVSSLPGIGADKVTCNQTLDWSGKITAQTICSQFCDGSKPCESICPRK